MLQCRAIFAAWENQHYQYCNETLDKQTYEGYERAIAKIMLAFAGFRIYWQMNRDVFSPTFTAHIDKLIADTPLQRGDALMNEWNEKIAALKQQQSTS